MNSPIENVTNSFKKKWSGIFSDNKDVLIILLSALLLLSILGVHFFHVILEAIENVVDRVLVLLGHVLAGVSYSTGEILNVSADTVSDVAKVTIDLGNGAINDVGDVLKSGGSGTVIQPPVPIHHVIPTFTQGHRPTKKAHKKSHKKATPEPDDGSDDEREEGAESMQTMWSPYVFTTPTGYAATLPRHEPFTSWRPATSMPRPIHQWIETGKYAVV